MSGRLLFISDLHLQAERPDITATLIEFLQRERGHCDALYILGDLFEVWLGDDGCDPLAERVAAALLDCQQHGCAVYLMHGNRDFLLGNDYASACGATLLPDPTLINTPVGRLALTHGDALCTDDVDYQAWRAQVRQSAWQDAFLSRPLAERQAFAAQARAQSQAATAGKDQAIMDVNEQAVLDFLQDRGLPRLLHGHTHRPRRHELQLDPAIAGATEGWRVVLGDWDQRGWVAQIDADGVRLDWFPLAG